MQTQPIHVLLVEDNPGDARFVREMVREVPGLDIHHVDRLASGLEHLAAQKVDVVLLDLGLPDSQGLDSLRAIIGSGCAAPVVVLTGHDDEELGRQAVREGAQDYLVKGRVAEYALTRAVRYAIERKRADQDLAQSVRKYRGLFEDAGDAIFIADAETAIILDANKKAEKLLDMPRQEIIGMNRAALHPKSEEFDEEFLRHVEVGKVTAEESMVVDRKGRHIPVHISATTFDLEGRKVIQGIFRDISEQKQAEEGLLRNQAMLARTESIAHVGSWEWDVATDTVAWSDELFRIFQRSPADGAPSFAEHPELYYPEDMQRLGEAVEMAVSDGTPYELEMRAIRKDGATRVCLARGNAEMGPKGRATRLYGSLQDITEHQRADEARAYLEAQLRTSQKMEAIGSLAGGIAHDFNNLLSVILSYTGFALDAVGDGGPVHDDLVEVKNAGERAAALVRQLLAFGRKQMLEPKVIDLNQITAELEKMLRRILGEDIDFVQKLSPDLGLTHADPSQIEQVIMNLVVNARDAMSEGGKLTIETSNTEIDDEYAASHVDVEPGLYVMLAVTDTGSGMDEGTRARIFEPFFTTKEKGKGTGLGLSTVYGIVRQSGGAIHVYSEPDQGTTFKIYLPRKPSTMIAESRTPMAPTHLTGDETIIVVEDEVAVCNLAKRILGAAGYTVLTAASGGEALAKCERHEGEIHLVLTDVVMPEMSGREFAERLAKVRKGIKILYMSGYTDNAIAHHGTLDPGTKFIGKPFNAADLARKVREALDEA